MAAFDFDKLKVDLEKKHGQGIRDVDLLSSALYPKVFVSSSMRCLCLREFEQDEYKTFMKKYTDISILPTRYFLQPLSVGEEVSLELEKGKTLWLKMHAVGELDKNGEREVFFELNGLPRAVMV